MGDSGTARRSRPNDPLPDSMPNLKKGGKLPSIEIEGHSDARFELIDGKIVRVPRRGN
jgi:hypothetical protein